MRLIFASKSVPLPEKSYLCPALPKSLPMLSEDCPGDIAHDMPKKEAVEKMFDSIAPEYDALNHILSLNIDKIWRRRAVQKLLPKDADFHILDVACGTGDFSIAVARRSKKARITGIDLSDGMLAGGREKVARLGLDDRIELRKGDCEALEFADDSFDGVCVGFGVRNFEHLEQGLREMRRVLRPGGRLVILELSVPQNRLLLALYKLYFLKILPLVGGKVSGDKAAYRYLPASVLNFPLPERFKAILSSCGFASVSHTPLTFGICRMYVASLPQISSEPDGKEN